MKAIVIEEKYETVNSKGIKTKQSDFFVTWKENSEKDRFEVDSLEEAKKLEKFINDGLTKYILN